MLPKAVVNSRNLAIGGKWYRTTLVQKLDQKGRYSKRFIIEAPAAVKARMVELIKAVIPDFFVEMEVA